MWSIFFEFYTSMVFFIRLFFIICFKVSDPIHEYDEPSLNTFPYNNFEFFWEKSLMNLIGL